MDSSRDELLEQENRALRTATKDSLRAQLGPSPSALCSHISARKHARVGYLCCILAFCMSSSLKATQNSWPTCGQRSPSLGSWPSKGREWR